MSGQRVAPCVLVGLAAFLVTVPALAAEPHRLQLPRPVHEVSVLGGVGLAPDRLLTSRTPGPVTNREAVTVSLGADGTPVAVTVEQRISITGTGDYQVRERGPARRVESIGNTVPPVLKLGTVVWQGFSPGRRELAARLTLDAGLEAPRLPLAVRLQFTDRDGRRTTLGPGGVVPGPGTVTVTLTNSTAVPVTVPVGTAEPAAVAPVLQSLLEAARRPRPGRPPTAGSGLPASVPGTASGTASVPALAALRVVGSIRMPATTARVTGPGATPLPDGARVRGTLQAGVSFQVSALAAGRLHLDLSVQPWLDPRTLAPPAQYRSWSAWAAGNPSGTATAKATRVLITEAANAARAAEYTPYLDADLNGTATTTYRYVVAPSAAGPTAEVALRPKPAAIATAAVAVLLILVDLGLIWRRL